MHPYRLRLIAVLLASALALSACDSAEERAQQHFLSAMQLLDEGDADRALVELRNVFQLNGMHQEARLTYARIQRERGDEAEAYSQYLLSAEQYPEVAESRLALAEMAISRLDWAEAERHGREAVKLLPDDPLAQAIGMTLDYRAAIEAKETAATKASVDAAAALLAAHSDSPGVAVLAHQVLIDAQMRGPNPADALPQLDAALALRPDRFDWQMMRLRLVFEAGDIATAGVHLQEMAKLFPANDQVRSLLIGWYVDQGDLDGAEAVMRDLVTQSEEKLGPQLAIVEFLRQTKGPEAALAEVDRLIAENPGAPAYVATRATMDFQAGRKDEAIAAMTALVKEAPDSPAVRDIRVGLAKMLVDTGNPVGARSEIEKVITADPTNVDALKMRAVWLIDEDKPGDAIIDLRTAFDQAPRDVDILTLMGQAHERDGARDLAGERYGLAVEVSGRAAPESLRYAAFLMEDDRHEAAESVLTDALATSPQNAQLLIALSDVLIVQDSWDRARETIARLRALNTDEASTAADRLEGKILLAQGQVDDTITFLQGMIDGGDTDVAAIAAVMQLQVREGRMDAARAYLDDRLALQPDSPDLMHLDASLRLTMGETDQAETLYRSLISANLQDVRAVRALFALLRTDDATGAEAVLDAGIAANPTSVALRVTKATVLEGRGDFDGAIALLETLYAENTDNIVLANNLASLLTTHRSDSASVERAFAIARRLRGTQEPAFQDTYGWIEYLRGNYSDAVAALEPAAAGLPDDALVQLHLGLTYAALNRTADARATLTRALDLAADSPLPQFAQARQVLEALPAN